MLQFFGEHIKYSDQKKLKFLDQGKDHDNRSWKKERVEDKQIDSMVSAVKD